MYLVKGQLANVKRHYVTAQCCSTRSLVYSNTPMKAMSFNMLHGYSHIISSYIAWCTFGSTSMYPSTKNATCKHSIRLGFHYSGLCHAWLEGLFMFVDFPWLGWAWLELNPLDTYGDSQAKHKSSRKPLESLRRHLSAWQLHSPWFIYHDCTFAIWTCAKPIFYYCVIHPCYIWSNLTKMCIYY
jgi:hypothetical protein